MQKAPTSGPDRFGEFIDAREAAVVTFQFISVTSLMLAIAALWFTKSRLWTAPFALFAVFGLLAGWLTPIATIPIIACAGILDFNLKANGKSTRAWATVMLAVAALILGLHLAPGFETVRMLSDADSVDHEGWSGIEFRADKALAGLFLLLAYRDRLCTRGDDWIRAFETTALPALLGIGGVYIVALLSGYVTLASSALPSPALLAVLLLRNLFFTVVAEEMLFRQLVQTEIAKRMSVRHAEALALFGASVLFGLAHLPGGPTFALLATLAGLVYGYVFARSGRVETAMATHLALNTVQALFLAPTAT